MQASPSVSGPLFFSGMRLAVLLGSTVCTVKKLRSSTNFVLGLDSLQFSATV